MEGVFLVLHAQGSSEDFPIVRFALGLENHDCKHQIFVLSPRKSECDLSVFLIAEQLVLRGLVRSYCSDLHTVLCVRFGRKTDNSHEIVS
jgi:hypothetical protein